MAQNLKNFKIYSLSVEHCMPLNHFCHYCVVVVHTVLSSIRGENYYMYLKFYTSKYNFYCRNVNTPSNIKISPQNTNTDAIQVQEWISAKNHNNTNSHFLYCHMLVLVDINFHKRQSRIKAGLVLTPGLQSQEGIRSPGSGLYSSKYVTCNTITCICSM